MNKPVYIYAASANLWPVSESAPELKSELKNLWGKSFRRINHFIELALIGAKRCVDGAKLPIQNDCPLILTTGQGNIHQVAQATQKIFSQNEAPMPFEFMHITNNMAGFYVAQALQLNSSNMTVSHEGFSFESALDLAMFNISSGRDNLCLLGAVDQCAYPLDHHKQRLGVSENTLLAEGSHWFLLGNTLEHAIAQCKQIKFFNQNELIDGLKQHFTIQQGYYLLSSSYTELEIKQFQLITGIKQDRIIHANTPHHDTASAFEVANFIKTNQGKSLVHINKSTDEKFCVFHVDVF